MDDYKYQQRRKKRGDHCCFERIDEAGVGRSVLCGCGTRNPPNKKHKTRIVKRKVKKDTQKEIDESL
jgi:hypothetical protein